MLERFSCPRRPTAHPFESPVRRHVTLKSSPPVSGAQCRNTVRTTKKAHCQHSALYILAERKGLEPSASGVTGRRYNRLNYRSGWWAVQDLNLWPPPCKGGAQPTELTAHHSRSLTRYVRQRQAARRGSGLIPVFFFSSRWLAASARRPGVVACAAGWLSFFPFLSGRWLAASARRPGVVACAAGGRGQGLAQPLAPTTPYPALGQPSLTDSTGTQSYPPISSLPRGSGQSAFRCPASTRDERPSGVGASAPFGAAISSAPCPAYAGKLFAVLSFPVGTAVAARRKYGFPLLIRRTEPKRRLREKKIAPR